MDASRRDRSLEVDVAFPEGLAHLERRIAHLHRTGERTDDARAILLDLEVAYEELRVADEEVRTQQEEISRLAESHQLLRWQHERMLEMVPVPVLTTDRAGAVRSANAAAAALVGMRLPQLLGKPLVSFVAVEDRPIMRTELSRLVGGGRWTRVVTLVDRTGAPRLLEASVTADAGSNAPLTWIFLAADAGPSRRPPGRLSLPEALVRLVTLPAAGAEWSDVLRRCAQLCQDVLGEHLSVSVSAGSPTAPDAVGSTSRTAQSIDGGQLAHEQGPCVTAFEERRTVTATDLCADARWPRLASDPRCRDAGGVVAVPLQVGDDLLGALNVYGEVGDPVDRQLVEETELLGAAVAAVFHELATRNELELTAADLERALTSRATIDQAKGIVMADRGCTAEEAFEHLVRVSSTQHLKLRDVAQLLVQQRTSGGSRARDRP
jgi:PAS domain S-box-containing protein